MGASVVISHSFLIATGYEETEPFEKYSGEILGIYAVYGFFILSGFLVTESARNSPDADIFLKNVFAEFSPDFSSAISYVYIFVPMVLYQSF
ncbi:hypothetical protein HED51_18730 [Ochrobactrum grignonense]|nr:hypothetical protein [Brucella grignonensis]